MKAKKTKNDGLWVVKDHSGSQWLCSSRPVLVGGVWCVGKGLDIHFVWKVIGCVRLKPHEGLDSSCFEGGNRWKAFRVTIVLA